MKKIVKVAFLSSVITGAVVYVLLEWRPLQSATAEAPRPPEISWASAPSPAATATTTAAPAAAPPAAGDDERNNIEIYQKYSPGVVNITSTVRTFDFFYQAPVQMQSGTGSGAIIDNQGHIVTNYHVIEDALRSRGGGLEVTLADKSNHQARVVGTDPNNDLAVLKIEIPTDRLTVIPLGTSRNLQVGQKVLAIGNPFGFLERTLTTGIISSLGRSIEAQNQRIIEEIIQTDAAINSGNSGGPLLNSNGEIIGINTAIIAGATGIGFAIPADTVRRVVDDLISIGYVRRPYLGITQPLIPLAEVPPLARELGIDAQGVLITQVTPGSPAADSGIRGASRTVVVSNYRIPVGGDVIVAFQGRVVNSIPELAAAIDRQKPGDRVTVTVMRGNQKVDIPVVLEEAPRPNQ